MLASTTPFLLTKIILIFLLTFLLKTDAQLLEISPKLTEKCNEDIRTISPLKPMMVEKMRKLFHISGDEMKILESKRSLSGGKTWGKRESPRPRPLRHGKRMDIQLSSSKLDRKHFGKSWKPLSGLFL